MSDLPLSGIRVVEFSTMITASYAAMLLSEQGADVIKVEPEAGDPMRRIGSQRHTDKGGMSALFANFNKGKRSLVLDLKDAGDLGLARSLCEGADVVISNYRPEVMTRIGLSYDALSAANPKLVFARITGFGSCGPQAGSPAYDHIMQAQLGLTVIQGGERAPRHMQTAICDKTTGLMAAQAVSSALVGAQRTGRGTRIDLSMLDAGMAFMFPDNLMDRTILSDDAVHLAPLPATYGVLRARDGAFVMAPIGDAMWTAVFGVLQRDDLSRNPKWSSMTGRMGDYPGLISALQEQAFPGTVAEALAALAAIDVPAAPCQSPDEALSDPQLSACKTVQVVEDPVLGPIRSVRPAAIFAGVAAPADRHAPLLGSHTGEIRQGGWD